MQTPKNSTAFFRLFGLSLLGAALALALPQRPVQSAALAVSADTQARVIVRFKPQAASVRAKIMSARMDAASARDVAQTRATALGLRTGLNSRNAQGLRAHLSLDERTHVITASGMSSADLARSLAADSEVELAVVDQRRRHTSVTPSDALYAGNGGIAPSSGNGSANGQWYLKAPAGEVVSSINAPAAWDISTGNPAIVVAVLDTGVRFDHPDLSGQFVASSAFSTGKVGYDMIGYSNASAVATANDGNRNDDDPSDPGDWVSQADITAGTLGTGCDSTDITNSSWHGTRTAGLIGAASNNAQGIAGVGWGIKLLPIRVLGKCGGYDSDIMVGMKWAAGIAVAGLPTNPSPAKVLNMSLGGTDSCTGSTGTLYRDVISQVTAAGATIVAAAGNSEGQAVGIPGNCPGVIAVAALRHVGSKVGFSSIGPEVTIAAPGGNCVNTSGACLFPMLSTTNSGTTSPVANDGSYTNNSASVGTSFSAPIVAGTVALMLSINPNLTPAQVMSTLKSTARPFVTTGGSPGIPQCVAPTTTVQDECYCTTSTCGAGMLDAAAAVAAAKAANPATTPQSIAFSVSLAQPTAGMSVTLSATASSGLLVNFTASPSTVCTVSGNSLTLLAGGTCTVTAKQMGNSVYVSAGDSVQSIVVSKANQTLSFPSIPSQTLGSTPAALNATATSSLPITYSSTSTSVCTVAGGSLTLLTAGNCSITASQPGNAAFAAAASVVQTFAVQAAQQSISFSVPAAQSLIVSPLTISATASSGLAVSFSAAPASVCALSGNSLTLLAVGSCTVTASQAGNGIYAAASNVEQTIVVSLGAQTITFPAIAAQPLSATPVVLSATASSGLPVTYSSGSPATCTVTGSSVTLVAAGSCSITASQAGNTTYAAANSMTQSFDVGATSTTSTTSGSSGGGGGGGAAGGWWVALLGLASWVLRRRAQT